MRLRGNVTALALLVLSAMPAFGQGTVLQGGPWQPGHVPQYVGQGSSQAVVQDGGGAGGGAVGVNPSEIGITARGTGAAPFVGQGTGPFGSNFTIYDAPINNPTGYHFLSLSANAQGGGLLAYGAGGLAAPLPFSFNINGVPYQFPFSGGGGITGKPFVILSSGQSNFSDVAAFVWRPDANATLWNSGFSSTTSITGTAYGPLSPSTVNMTWSIASAVATANPARRVCLINISYPGLAISYWLPGTPAPDMFQAILDNIAPALAACGGATKIDLFEWWQGEGDTNPLNTNYIGNFTTLMNRFWAAQIGGINWFPQETPVVIQSIASTAISGNADGDHMNALLQGVVNADTDKRRYVYTADLPSPAYWDTGNPGHMTGLGYYSAGVMSASAFLNGTGRSSLPNVTVNPASRSILFGNPGFSSAPIAINENAVGVTLPSTPATFQLGGADGLATFQIIDAFGNFTNYVGRRANGTLAAPTALASGDLIVGLGAQGYDATGYASGNKASVSCFAAEAWSSATNHGTYCSIFNTIIATNTGKETLRAAPGIVTVQGLNSTVVIPGDAPLTVNSNSAAPSATTLSPDLHLVGANSVNSGILLDSYGNSGVIVARANGGTLAAPAAIGAGVPYFGIGVQTYDGFGYTSNAGFDFITGNAQSASDHSALLRLNTTPKGSTTSAEAWRTQASGGFSIGTTADSGIGTLILKKQAFASLTACSSTIEGAMASITDSSTITWGATITGGSTNHVMGYCDGTNWTVAAK